MEAIDIMKAQALALQTRAEHEKIEVTMLKTKLRGEIKFTIDDRSPLPRDWKLGLLDTCDPFIMKDLQTGAIIFEGNTCADSIKDIVRSD